MPKEIFTAIVTTSETLKVKCSARDFSFYLDEPKNLGGTNEAMNPVEALLSALGACKCIVAKSFANTHRINLHDIKIEITGELDTDGFIGKNKLAKIGFSKVISKFFICADNNQQEIEAFVQFIEQTCPVLDSLINTPHFLTEINVKN